MLFALGDCISDRPSIGSGYHATVRARFFAPASANVGPGGTSYLSDAGIYRESLDDAAVLHPIRCRGAGFGSAVDSGKIGEVRVRKDQQDPPR